MPGAAPPLLLPPEGMRWGRWAQGAIEDLQRAAGRRLQGEANAGTRTTGAIGLLSAQVLALPIVESSSATATGFAVPTTGWTRITQVSIAVPDGKNTAQVFVVGGAAAVDTTSGGLTNASARITIAGTASASFQAAKDAGASAVNNILTPSFGLTVPNLTDGSSILITLDMSALNPAAFPAMPANYASLSAFAVFSGS